MLTTKEAAGRVGVPLRTLQAWIATGHLPAVKLGRDWLIDERDLARLAPPPMGRPKRAT